MKRPNLKQLRSDMDFVCKHYKLSAESKKMAQIVAMESPVTAARCYRAIVNSFRSGI